MYFGYLIWFLFCYCHSSTNIWWVFLAFLWTTSHIWAVDLCRSSPFRVNRDALLVDSLTNGIFWWIDSSSQSCGCIIFFAFFLNDRLNDELFWHLVGLYDAVSLGMFFSNLWVISGTCAFILEITWHFTLIHSFGHTCKHRLHKTYDVMADGNWLNQS